MTHPNSQAPHDDRPPNVALTSVEVADLAAVLGSITLTPEIWSISPHMAKVKEVVERIVYMHVVAEGRRASGEGYYQGWNEGRAAAGGAR